MSPRIAIVGGGWGGIIAAVKLKQRGITSFTIFERQHAPGGVWNANTFPGLGVDVPAHLYSFSFKRHYDWTRSHPLRDEILRYTNEIVDEWGLRPHFRFNTTVSRLEWNEDRHTYSVTIGEDEIREFDVVVSAVGVFHTPRYPDWPGLDEFEGTKFHTRFWDHSHDFSHDTVALVGTGATAIQTVPEVAAMARKLYVYQREPGWVIPRGDREWTVEERAQMARPYVQRMKRIQMYARFERLIFGMRRIREKKTPIQITAENYIMERLAERPDLRAAVTPSYPFGGKRPLFDGQFYEALARDNVELVPFAVKEMTHDGIVSEDGIERKIDTLIMATGYKVANYVGPLEVIGRDGKNLHAFWQGEPTAFCGITVPGFPNFYILYGPNTNGGGSVSVQLERQGEFVARAAQRMKKEGVTSIEVTPWAYLSWDAYLRWRNSKQVYSASKSYYRGPSGKVLTEWPGTMTEYWFLTRAFGRLSSVATRRPRAQSSDNGSPQGSVGDSQLELAASKDRAP
jgi:cation diffusion facilitator CzcD-associated flavoprotein CzcO